MDPPWFVYPLIYYRTFGLLPFWAIINEAAMNYHVQVCVDINFHLDGMNAQDYVC